MDLIDEMDNKTTSRLSIKFIKSIYVHFKRYSTLLIAPPLCALCN